MYLASALLLPIVYINRSEFRKLATKEWLILVTSGVFLALHFAFWFESLKLTTVASSTIILSLQPIVALIAGFFIYKERTSQFVLFAIGMSVIGVMMVGWGDFGSGSKEVIIGDLLSFLSVTAIVCYLMIGQNTVKHISHWIYSFSVFFFAAFTLHMYNLIVHVPLIGYDAREWGIFLLLAIFPTIAHVIYNYLLNIVNTTTISMSILGEPIGATLLATLLLGERLIGLQIVGGIFVLFGVFLFLRQQAY